MAKKTHYFIKIVSVKEILTHRETALLVILKNEEWQSLDEL